ncbi:MAG: PDDEXK nuclease domain-containing protein [Christensenellaceae bacterium]|nr:PDDEXK nuclease domain-containing protein [Christensenellaceae bacterium]
MLINNSEYFEVLNLVKKQIREAQYRAVLGVNREQTLLFWNIGLTIIKNKKHGNALVENRARDMRAEFPNVKGLSVRNLRYMRRFAEIITDVSILQTVSAELSGSHNALLLDKAKEFEACLWYAEQTIKNGWSLSVLEHHFDTKLYKRQVIADKTANNAGLPPSLQSELAQGTLKSPYVFDFIERRAGIIEREIENEMVASIAKTLLEQGRGFAFKGNQYHLQVGDKDYYIDLLFYNTDLRCHIVIEIKTVEFAPEHAGKLNFYLSAVDDLLKHPTDNPSIGILLCKKKNKLIAEYALKDMTKPISVAKYKLSDFVPEELSSTLPSIEDLEKRVKMQLDIKDDGD